MDDRTRLVLESVSEGVWNEGKGVLQLRQCFFCCVAPGNEHHENCPVRVAREVLEDS